MAISKYNNFAEYEANDANYFTRALRGELHKTQSKIFFKDGSTYHVTKSGTRYWERHGHTHREDGPAVVWGEGHRGNYYLFSLSFQNKSEFDQAMKNLTHLRELTDNTIESTVTRITAQLDYKTRLSVWSAVLNCSENTDQLLVDLEHIQSEYRKIHDITNQFVSQYRKPVVTADSER